MVKHPWKYSWLVVVAVAVFPTVAKSKDTLTVIASGETHAMLLPCDCPVEPGGGLAKRSHAIKSATAGMALVVDAGGFSGGGLYDSYTEGRAVDSLRTLAAIRAMAALHYDAACVGDDDLQYGGAWLAAAAANAGLPLVSANCQLAGRIAGVLPYIILKKGPLTYAITGLTTQEKLYSFPEPVGVLPPVEALRKIWPEMIKKADFRIVLSHLGEEMTRMIADSFPECDIIVNGHRKISTQPVFYSGHSLVMQFGFAGKNLSRASFVPDKKGLSLINSAWVPVTPDLPDDPVIAKLIDVSTALSDAGAPTSAMRQNVLDLYIMSQCPFGLKALKEMIEAISAFPKVAWNIRFVGSQKDDGSLSSLHGDGEVHDEMLWLAMQALYPGQWRAFLLMRAAAPESTTTESIIRKIGADYNKLVRWVGTNGRQELAIHYNRSTRIGIQASPTLLLNNSPVDLEITKPRLGKMLCSQTPGSSTYCDSVPECFDNRDCKRKGTVGTCVNGNGKSRCEYKEAVRFTFTVLVSDSIISHPEREIIGTTRDLFEGAAVETVWTASEAGRKLLAAFEPAALPYYLFDTKVREAENYSQIEQGLEEKKNKLVFKKEYIKKVYWYTRPLVPASCDMYIDPMFPGAKEALSIALHKKNGVRVRIHPLLSVSPDIDSISGEDRLGREEAQRWLLFIERYPAKYASYLESFMGRKDASYWFLSLGDLKIKTDDFVGRIKADNSRVRTLWKTQTELGISGPVEIVINNREVVRVKGQKELAELLGKLGKQP
jgi:hypothetical protein